MLKYDKKLMFFKHRICWFSPCAPRFSLVRFDEYRQSFDGANRNWYLRKNFNTIVIDLSQDAAKIFSQFNAVTRNEVRKAERTGVEASELQVLLKFISFYNEFANSKKRETILEAELSNICDDVVIREAKMGGNTLVMHAYILDREIGYVRLLHSASLFRLYEDRSLRNAISAANRYLHFSDIVYFKGRNFKFYDLGGVPPASSDDAAVNQIAQFKRGFGGVEVEQFNYMSLNLVLARNVKAAIARLLSPSKPGRAVASTELPEGN